MNSPKTQLRALELALENQHLIDSAGGGSLFSLADQFVKYIETGDIQ